jgi:hypothetical protein
MDARFSKWIVKVHSLKEAPIVKGWEAPLQKETRRGYKLWARYFKSLTLSET